MIEKNFDNEIVLDLHPLLLFLLLSSLQGLATSGLFFQSIFVVPWPVSINA